MTTQAEFRGFQQPSTNAADYGVLQFVFAQLLGKIATVALVRIVSVTNAGGLEPVGFVDVQPLVNQLSGDQEATPHGTVYNVPYMRLQGGANAVILDPEVGDIGMCGFCSRDISAVKVARAPANPGSFRSYDWADGLYLGGFLNGTPQQYVRFSAEGIEVVSPSKVTIRAPAIELDGPVTATSTVTAATEVTANGKALTTHRHGGVQSGGSNTGPPV